MTYITADQARINVTAVPTTEQLEQKYGLVRAIIERRSQQRYYTTDMTAGDGDILEFKQFIKTQGFNAWTETTSATPLPAVTQDTQGTERTVRISWQTYTITLSLTPGISPPQVAASITTVGVTDEPTLLWTNTGTVDGEEDFATEVNSGNISLSPTGTATLLLDLKAGYTPGQTVKLTLKRAGSEPTTLAESNTITLV
jgi:hypothetical protein